jgi:glutathione S-transferase
MISTESSSATTIKPLLGYWAIRGLGQYCRMTLEAAGVDYDEKRYTDFNEWFGKDKPASPCLLPNLPYYIDGDIKISETDSIMRTIARLYKPELLGKTSANLALCDMITMFVIKYNVKLRAFCYKKDTTDEDRIKMVKENASQFTSLNKHFESHKFVCGDYLTIADIALYETWQAMKVTHAETCK